MLKFTFHGIKIYTDLYIYNIYTHVYMYTSIDRICVEVFEKTIRGTEMTTHSKGNFMELC